MKILMRNTVFKTAALAGLFSCMLVLVGAFSGTTASVHAITAAEVETKTELKQFVEEAVDAYYIDFLLKQHCDLRELALPAELVGFLPTFLGPYGIEDLSPSSIQMLSPEDIKRLIGLFNSPAVQAFLPDGLDIWGTCDLPQPPSTFRQVFGGSEEENWKSGSIYLLVAQYPDEIIVFHGENPAAEGQDFTDLKDADSRPVMELIEQAADDLVPGQEKGFVEYCWDDPTVEGDGDEDDGDILTAPGDSWKISYVVDPFDYLEVPAPSDLPRVIFTSGIYPKNEDDGMLPSGCQIYGDDGDDMDGDGDDMDGDGDDMDGDGDETPLDPVKDIADSGGCTIAAGSDSTPRGTAFNLLLMVSALFLAVSFRSRAMDKRNGVRS